MKDPAFLFYSNDFYGGTRMMLPEERACYIDLMIYQHQYGYIPDDTKRVLMYCSGIDEATLKAVLTAKFKHSDKGWYNERLSQVIEKRETYSKERSVSGTVGQFWKKIKSELSQREYMKLRGKCSHVSNEEIISLVEQFKNESITTPKAMLEAMLKHIGNEIEIGIENKEIKKGITKGEKSDDQFEEFRRAYPGSKRGCESELKTLQRHADWREVLPLLLPALKSEIDWRRKAKEAGVWTPEWAHLQTWINQRRWEQELKPIDKQATAENIYTPPVKRELSTEEQIRLQFGPDADPRDYFFNVHSNRFEKLASKTVRV